MCHAAIVEVRKWRGLHAANGASSVSWHIRCGVALHFVRFTERHRQRIEGSARPCLPLRKPTPRGVGVVLVSPRDSGWMSPASERWGWTPQQPVIGFR